MDELLHEGALDSIHPSSVFADSSYWTQLSEKIDKSQINLIARSELKSTAPSFQPSIESAPSTFLTVARNAYESWWRTAQRANDSEELKDVFKFFAMVEAPYSRVRVFAEHALPLSADFDGDAQIRFYTHVIEATVHGDCELLHLFLLQHAHARGYGGRLQGNLVTQGGRQQFFELIVKACSHLPTLKEMFQRSSEGSQLTSTPEDSRSTEKLEAACTNYRSFSQRWTISMTSCGILAFSLLTNSDTVMQGATGIWLRSFIASERVICDIIQRTCDVNLEKDMKNQLLHLAADAIHVLALVNDPRFPLVPTANASPRTPSLGQSPLHVVLQVISEDSSFLRISHSDLCSFFPYSQLLGVVTTVVHAEGRLRLSLCGAMLDLQRQSPAVGDGLILRVLQHLMSNRGASGGSNSLPIHRHMMMMADDRRGNAQVQQHVMEEGLIHAFAVTLLFHLEKARGILESKCEFLTTEIELHLPGKESGYPRLPLEVSNLLAPAESIIVMVLDMCRGVVVVSQHHSTNPVAFLLTPMGSHPHPLGSTLLDFLKDFSSVTPSIAVSATSFLAACIHHNVRDVVPALQERGALDMLLSWIHPENAPRIRPIVKLCAVQVFQAFFVHPETRAIIRERSSHLISIFDGLVECVEYPTSRVAMDQEAAAKRDWPQKIPSDIIMTCGKDFFAIARELTKVESTPLFTELCGLFAKISPNLGSPSLWKVREALQQLVEFISASAPNPNSGRSDRDFWARRRDDAEAVSSPEMTALRAAGLGSHLHTIVNGMLANRIAASENDDETSAAGSATQTAAALSFDVLAPLLTRIDRGDFIVAFAPVLKTVSDIASSTRQSKHLRLSDAWTLQAILQFVTQLPDGRRCPIHVITAREHILSNLNDVYCICMQNFRRPPQHVAPGVATPTGPGALSQLPPAPEGVAAFMSSMQKLFASGVHQTPSLHPLGNLSVRGRGSSSENSPFNSIERAVETLETQALRWRDERTTSGLVASLISVVVQLQATQSMLSPTTTNSLRSMPPTPLMASTRLTELVRLLKSLVALLPCVVAAKDSAALPATGLSEVETAVAELAPPVSIDSCIVEALELVFSVAKIAVSGNRLVARDNDRRRDICLMVSLYFEYLASAKYVTKRILSSVMQLLSIASRGVLFASPPSQSTSAGFGGGGSSPMSDLWQPSRGALGDGVLDLDNHDAATETLRNNVVGWLVDAMGPLYLHCEEIEALNQSGKHQHEIVPGHQGISGSALDLELRRAAAQVLFAAIGSPHYRESAVDVIARCVKKDFAIYSPLLHLLAVCISQKGNLNLRKGIATMTALPTFLLEQLTALTDRILTQQQSHIPAENEQANNSAQAHTLLRRELRHLEYILTVFHSLQTPPSPSTRHHQVVERICEHYQNGFCWHGPECPNAHADTLMNMRPALESTDARFIDRLRAVFPSQSERLKVLPLETPAFVGGLGVSLLRPADACALLTAIARCLVALAKEQTHASNSTFAAVPLQFPTRDHASVVFQAAVRVGALQLHLDHDHSKEALYLVPLEVFAAFDRELPASHRALVAHLVRYSLEDSFASDALMYRCLTKIAEEQIQEDKGRHNLVQELLPEQQLVLERAQRTESSWQGHASSMFSQGLATVPPDTPGLRPASPPPPPPPACSVEASSASEVKKCDKPRIQAYLFPLSEVILDFSSTGSKYIVAASRAVSTYCVPACTTAPAGRPPRKGYVWIAPQQQQQQCTLSSSLSATPPPPSHSKHYRALSKQFLREVMLLHQRKAISSEFVVALLSECASLPHVQLAAYSRQKQHLQTHGHNSSVPHETETSESHGRSMLLQLMGQFQNPKIAPFLWSVTMRHPKLAVTEWIRSINDELTAAHHHSRLDGWHQDRWSLDGVLTGIEGILRHSPHSRDRLTKELSAPEVVKVLCALVAHPVTLQRTAGLSLLFICSLLKIVAPPTSAAEVAPTAASEGEVHERPASVHVDPTAEGERHGTDTSAIFEDAFDQLIPDPNADLVHMETDEDGMVEDDEVTFDEHHDDEPLREPTNDDDEEPEVAQEMVADDDDNAMNDGEVANEEDDDDEDEDDDDNEDGDDEDEEDGENFFMDEGPGQNRNAPSPDHFPMDEDDDEFRIIGRDGEHIEVRLTPGGAHSLIVRGGSRGEDPDPDFIRELLFRAHMAEFGGGPDRFSGGGSGGLQRFLRRHEQRSAPTHAVNPEEAAAVFWHSSVGMGRVVQLPAAAPPAPREVSPSPEAMLQQMQMDSQRRAASVNADDLILQLFGGSTRTPSNQATQGTQADPTMFEILAPPPPMPPRHSMFSHDNMWMPPHANAPPLLHHPRMFSASDVGNLSDSVRVDSPSLRVYVPPGRRSDTPSAAALPSPTVVSPMTPFYMPPPTLLGATPPLLPLRPPAPAPRSPSSAPQHESVTDDDEFLDLATQLPLGHMPGGMYRSTGSEWSLSGSGNRQPTPAAVPAASVPVAPPAVPAVEIPEEATSSSSPAQEQEPVAAPPAATEAPTSEDNLPWEGSLDPQFLAELPAEVRQDILMEHFPILTVSQSHIVEGRTTHLHPLFLAALPSELQLEILTLEARVTSSAAQAIPQPTEASSPQPAAAAAAAAPELVAPPSETIMLLSLINEPDIRRDILMTCDLSELTANAELHAEAVRLRAERDAAQLAARQAQQAREEMARQEAHARMIEAQRRAAHQRENVHLRRFGRDDEEGFPLRARDRTQRVNNQRQQAPPSGWSMLRTSPLSPAVVVELCRFVDPSSQTSASHISRILSTALEGASYDEIHTCLHLLLDFATKPLSSKTAEQLSRANLEAMNNNRNHRPIVVRNATRLHQGDVPPASFVVQIIGILASLIQKSRSVALSLLVLPSDHLPLPHGEEAKHLPMGAKEQEEEGGPLAAFVFRALSQREHKLLENLPFSRLLQLLESRSDAPEVADAVEGVLSPLVQIMNTLESESGCVTQERLDAVLPPPTATPAAPVIQHPQHPHPIQWSDTFVDPRYQSRPFQCNLCRVTSHFWGYRCAHCHFDLCPACALDATNATTQKARMSRWGYWVVAATPLLSQCASILSRNVCKERTAVRLVCLLSRGIRLCGHTAAPSDEALCELESILCKHAKDLMCGIREAVRRIEDIQLTLRNVNAMSTTVAAPTAGGAASETASCSVAPSAQQQSLVDVAALARRKDLLISKALMLMELPEEMMRNVYLLFLPYAETQRSQLRPEIRQMFHASRVYLLEISNLLSQHPNRLRAVLPAAAFPLLNGYAQFHMLYGTGDGTESISMAERSETERLLSEKQTDVSAVSDVAWAAAQAARRAANNNGRGGNEQQRIDEPREERENLPHHIYKFCEANRTLINTLIHWDPTLLDEGLKFITRAPRLVDLDFKLKNFRKSFLRSRQRTQQHSITINRMNCFQDSFKAIKDLPEPCPIHVRFQQEEGSDAGGLVREWFQILGEEMVNDNYALFVHSSEGMTYQPNPCSGVNANHLEYFRFCGMVVGLAVYNDISMDVHFTRSVYRHMIGAEPCFRDVETMDPMMYTNLEKLLSLDIAPEMNLDFTVTFERFGKTEEAELIPNGANILVTNENKKEYIRLRSAFIMTQQIEAQLREFLIGFYKMVPRKEVQTFTEQELELVISGLPDIDVEDLRLNTEYNGYGPSSPVIRWFWEIVSSMTRQDRANLLQFATGSSKVPLGGFANLESGGHRHRFSITKTDTAIELLPSAHTCFNRIDIPEYTTADMLREKLMIAITYGNKGFTMV